MRIKLKPLTNNMVYSTSLCIFIHNNYVYDDGDGDDDDDYNYYYYYRSVQISHLRSCNKLMIDGCLELVYNQS